VTTRTIGILADSMISLLTCSRERRARCASHSWRLHLARMEMSWAEGELYSPHSRAPEIPVPLRRRRMRLYVHRDGINYSSWTVRRRLTLLGSVLEAILGSSGIGLLTLTSPRPVFSPSIRSDCHSFRRGTYVDFTQPIQSFLLSLFFTYLHWLHLVNPFVFLSLFFTYLHWLHLVNPFVLLSLFSPDCNLFVLVNNYG